MDNLKMFSPTEKQILKIMRATKKKLTITEIAEKFYNDEPKPIDPNAIMSGAVLNINKKCRYNKLSWSINSKGLGRGGKTVWIEDEK